MLREAEYVAERYEEAERLSTELHALHDDLTTFVEGGTTVSARFLLAGGGVLALRERGG